MCGIAGFWEPSAARTSVEGRDIITSMTDALIHRGPDDSGFWMDEGAGLVVGSRRLAILDLSIAGHQPMSSHDGRCVLAYNGELYNHADLRREITSRSISFRGTSDTEVLVEAISCWGVRGTLERANGMFAFAVWDREARTLVLARDRLGEKPLYYGWFGRSLVFASELKPFRRHPAFQATIDRDALAGFVRHGFFTGERTVFENVRRLAPGTMIEVREGDAPAGRPPEAYWHLEDVANDCRANPFAGTRTEAVEAVRCLIDDSVRLRTIADVPVGAFLSGGIDSSTVVASMKRCSNSVRTFSIGFREDTYDEAIHARRVAAYLGTDHTELYVTADDAIDVIPRLPAIFDEPFGDPSAIPTLLVSSLAKKSVTVALSGDGGDELFAGYTRHAAARRVWPVVRRVPLELRGALARSIGRLRPATLDRLGAAQRVLPGRWRQTNPGEKMQKLGPLLGATDVVDLYRSMLSLAPHAERLVLGAESSGFPATTGSLDDVVDVVRLCDTLAYLPDDILTKVDRASMAVSLEARVPLLDHRLVELAWSMPPEWHWDAAGRGKSLLRDVLARDVPRDLTDRPKMGFGVPIGAWLRGPLKSWAYDLLDPDLLDQAGYLHGHDIRTILDDHVAGRRDWKYVLWAILMFQSWYAEF